MASRSAFPILLTLLLFQAGSARSQDDAAQGHGMHAMAGAKSGAAPFVMDKGRTFGQNLDAAMEVMHSDMSSAERTGDADFDFAAGMIPHHQGAIDMARTVLAFGDDPEIRRLAEAIVAAQEKEIAFMRGWMRKNRPVR